MIAKDRTWQALRDYLRDVQKKKCRKRCGDSHGATSVCNKEGVTPTRRVTGPPLHLIEDPPSLPQCHSAVEIGQATTRVTRRARRCFGSPLQVSSGAFLFPCRHACSFVQLFEARHNTTLAGALTPSASPLPHRYRGCVCVYG